MNEGLICPLLSIAGHKLVPCRCEQCAWHTGKSCAVAQKGGVGHDRVRV